MERRTLGQGLSVTKQGLGCMGMSEFYGARNDDESIATIHAYLDAGGNFLDTADMYGPFINEELVGRAIAGRRDDVVLATKFGNQRGEKGEFLGVNGQPEYVRTSCEASLRRLGVETIDLYYQHRVDVNVPVEETWGAMKELVEAGKVRYLGISEASAATLARAHAVHPVTAIQSEYSLWTRDPEDGVLQTCRELGIGFVAYSPLGRGFLTSNEAVRSTTDNHDFRRFQPRFNGENAEKNAQLIASLEPIPGTKRRTWLVENLAANDIVLSPSEVSALEAAVPRDAVAGERYYPAGMLTLNL